MLMLMLLVQVVMLGVAAGADADAVGAASADARDAAAGADVDADAVGASVADASAVSSSAFSNVLVGNVSSRQLICVPLLGVLPKWGMCCTYHLDQPSGCRVISSSGLVGTTAAGSSSMAMMEGSISMALPFFCAASCSATSSAGDASCSWNSYSKFPIAKSI